MKKILCALLGLILTLPGFAACPSGQVEQTYTSATGTVAQNGTPTPTNPVEPTFYQQGDMILRKVGDYADSYDAATGKITRRVGVRVFDGTEGTDVNAGTNPSQGIFSAYMSDSYRDNYLPAVFTHFENQSTYLSSAVGNNQASIFLTGGAGSMAKVVFHNTTITSETAWRQWLAEQYAAGTPVTVYYPLATPVEETPASTTYCADTIKIATTAYNAARFNPVKTDLNSAVATIRDIVTKTINQTAAIASLQADKQTRPADACPAGKKCLLVETEENGVIVPHWYEIIENAYGLPSEYTQVDYVTNTAQTMINTGVKFDFSKNYEIELKASGVTGSWYILQARESSGAPISGISGSQSGNIISLGFNGTYIQASQTSRVIGHIYYIKGTINNGNLTLYVKDETAGTEDTVTGTYTPTTGQSVDTGLFGNTGGNYVATNSNVYFARIKEDGNYIMDYVPAKQGTTAGFYDKVSGTFKTATGLSAGPAVQ